jgi:hypothetical protein
MTHQQAAIALLKAGFTVSLPRDGHISACCDEYDPPPELKAQGIDRAWAFGLAIYRIEACWIMRRGGGPSHECETLEAALALAVEALSAYRSAQAST